MKLEGRMGLKSYSNVYLLCINDKMNMKNGKIELYDNNESHVTHIMFTLIFSII